MKQITITVPDNCELKQEGNTYTIVEKEKKLTYYEDVARELFGKDKRIIFIEGDGNINELTDHNLSYDDIVSSNNCTSKKQAEKLLAINKLMNVAKYLNGDWQPDWNNYNERKYYIYCDNGFCSRLRITCNTLEKHNTVYFKSKELAQQAIEILGEEIIKLALCTDY